jgi:hypothetical protein
MRAGDVANDGHVMGLQVDIEPTYSVTMGK